MTPSVETLPDWPMFGLADDVRPLLAEVLGAGDAAVLATLYAVVGGSPRPAGSQMLVARDRLAGFVSGGCIEADITAHARITAEHGRPQRLVYGDGSAFADIRLACGGRVEILLERIGPDDEAALRLLDLTRMRRPALWLSDGLSRACWDAQARPPALPASLTLAAGPLLATPHARCVTVRDGAAVGLRYRPVRRMVVVGGDPTALAIASLAAQSGFQSWLVRPKGPPEPPPLAGVHYERRAVEQAFDAIGLDRWTYVAVATHEAQTDEPALVAALQSCATYVGVLGARRRLPERLARLRASGVAEESLARLKAPIGLDIGGKAPFEIAVAVLAQAIAHGEATFE